jgi:hypothetical protein
LIFDFKERCKNKKIIIILLSIYTAFFFWKVRQGEVRQGDTYFSLSYTFTFSFFQPQANVHIYPRSLDEIKTIKKGNLYGAAFFWGMIFCY